jgi:hypothetical protein
MGAESHCNIVFGKRASEGKALLESEALLFRGDFRLSIAFKETTSLEAKNGELHVTFPGGTAVFTLGPLAEKWATKIRNPKGLIDKLGVKPGSQVVVLGVADESFWRELKGRTGAIQKGRAKANTDVIFLAAETKADLEKLGSLQKSLKKDGAIWVVWPKGKPELKENDVIAAAKVAGLVDVKVVKFSESLSALKVVIPVARR